MSCSHSFSLAGKETFPECSIGRTGYDVENDLGKEIKTQRVVCVIVWLVTGKDSILDASINSNLRG